MATTIHFALYKANVLETSWCVYGKIFSSAQGGHYDVECVTTGRWGDMGMLATQQGLGPVELRVVMGDAQSETGTYVERSLCVARVTTA
ncbi:hypothetical protein PHMEG_0006170 [Phytophthora megakarya]|uniref:Uncharacterized protein n=1 Tax=Phytophthora megakarya TaxID=4795 RepID=A0A225WPL2_9STRA|nr:hypothetical protein PHMEG_0006170 [Phytophthora megakarya]